MLNINGIKVAEVPVKPKELEFDKVGKSFKYVDEDGKEVKKIQVQASEYKWVYTDGTEFEGKACKSINGEAVSEYEKETDRDGAIVISDIKKIYQTEQDYFIENELTYMLVSEPFKAEIKALSKSEMVMTFPFSIKGLKAYTAVVSYNHQLDRVFMRLWRGDLRESNLDESEVVVKEKKTTKAKKLKLGQR